MTRLALIAHDDEKPTMVALVQEREDLLAEFDLVATGTTGERIAAETGLAVERKESGPIGGDTQIGAEVVEGVLDGIVFLRDPLTSQPHEPDITALLRLCDVHDVPMATTRSSAEFLLDGLASESGEDT
ncbi:methylglyoxal synthase [Halorussus lipolyticus]|uniref:methylglyoxal synthase n=1 Tax=Halorussus lipolyticus TaxID=3034024 RepID=UPI0023E79DCA|nr:methylglyoxal synthase [Halorussus sp. DT80]